MSGPSTLRVGPRARNLLRFFKAVIRSVAALTYAEAQARIDDAHVTEEEGEEEEKEEEMEVDDGGKTLPRSLDRRVTRALKTMFSLTQKMRARRSAAGALELASPEVRFELAGDGDNDPIDAGMYQIRGANRMVSFWFFNFFFVLGFSSRGFSKGKKTQKTQKKHFFRSRR